MIVVVYIVIYVANLTLAIPSMILGAGNLFLHLRDGKAMSLPLAILTTLLQSVQYIFSILMVVAVGICYFNLTESKEGTGLLERINKFGVAGADSNIKPEEY